MLHTGFRTFHFVLFLYVFFFSFLFLLFRFFSHYFVFVFLRFVFFRFFSLLFSLFSFRFFPFRFFSFFSVSQFTGTHKNRIDRIEAIGNIRLNRQKIYKYRDFCASLSFFLPFLHRISLFYPKIHCCNVYIFSASHHSLCIE